MKDIAGGRPIGWTVAAQSRFATWMNEEIMLYLVPEYGTVSGGALNSVTYFEETIKSRVEAALTDYLKANFRDLDQ